MDANTPRIALLVTDYLGNTKGEWYHELVSDAIANITRLADGIDTVVWVYDTNSNGERTGNPTARISKDGLLSPQWTTL